MPTGPLQRRCWSGPLLGLVPPTGFEPALPLESRISRGWTGRDPQRGTMSVQVTGLFKGAAVVGRSRTFLDLVSNLCPRGRSARQLPARTSRAGTPYGRD